MALGDLTNFINGSVGLTDFLGDAHNDPLVLAPAERLRPLWTISLIGVKLPKRRLEVRGG